MEQKKFDLDVPLLHFTRDPNDPVFTARDSVEGVQIFGGIGSGKTSGSGRTLALKYLQADYGGLVLTAKPDEVELWKDYCEQAGRPGDLIIVEPGGWQCFNFLEYESSGSKEVSYAENVFSVLKTVIKSSEEQSKGKSDDQFWESSLDMFMTNVITLCMIAYDKVTVQMLYDVARTAPRKRENTSKDSNAGKANASGKENTAVKDNSSEQDQKPKKPKATPFDLALSTAKKRVAENFEAWRTTGYMPDVKGLTEEQKAQLISDNVKDYRELQIVKDFFMSSLFTIGEKTRAIIDFSFTGFLFRLLREPVYSLFCKNKSTFTPEDSLEGRIIIINLPVKTYDKVGRDCQIMFKYIWQRAMERRNIKENDWPVFLWADEAQNFLHEYDAVYQATARSSRIATVYITQNLPNYFASMSGERGQFRVQSFLGTLGTKLFHANADVETNEYASRLIGQDTYKTKNGSMQMGDKSTMSSGWSENMQSHVKPNDFQQLKTGGPENNHKIEAYIHMQSKRLKDGRSYQKISFNQLSKLQK